MMSDQKGARPSHVIKKRDGEALVEVTGLWPQTSKKGVNYLGRYIKDTDTNYLLFDRKPGKSDASIAALFIKKGGADLGEPVDTFTVATSKSGQEYLKGSNGYIIFKND